MQFDKNIAIIHTNLYITVHYYTKNTNTPRKINETDNLAVSYDYLHNYTKTDGNLICGDVVEMVCGLYSFIISFAFFLLDLMLIIKYEGLRPMVHEVQKKMVEFGVDIIIFPYLVLLVTAGRILSEDLDSAIPFALIILIATFLAALLSIRAKNRPGKFIKFTKSITRNVIIANTLVIALIGILQIKLLCKSIGIKELLGIIFPLTIYALLSTRYLHIIKQGIPKR